MLRAKVIIQVVDEDNVYEVGNRVRGFNEGISRT